MTNHNAGPWIMAGLIVAAPAVYLIRVMSAGWSGYHTMAVIAIAGACAWRFAGVFGAGAEHALRNRRARDDSRTTTMIEAVARPALTDSARAELLAAQTAETWARVDAGRGAERKPVPVRVWSDGSDEDEGGYDDADA